MVTAESRRSVLGKQYMQRKAAGVVSRCSATEMSRRSLLSTTTALSRWRGQRNTLPIRTASDHRFDSNSWLTNWFVQNQTAGTCLRAVEARLRWFSRRVCCVC